MRGQRIDIFNERFVYNRRFRVNSFEFEMAFTEDAFNPISEQMSYDSKLRFEIHWLKFTISVSTSF